MEAYRFTLIYLAIGAGGGVLEAITYNLYLQSTKKRLKKYHFSFARYIFILLPLTLASIIVVLNLGFSPIKIFLTFMIAGPLLEWLLGFAYHGIVGVKLWTYYRYSIAQYTSWLALPFWGFAGIMFWLIATETVK